MKKFLALLLILSLVTVFGCAKKTAVEYYESAELYLSNKDYLKAAGDYVRAYQTDPKMIEAYLGAMQMYEKLGVEYRYYECIDLLVENNPDNPLVYITAAEIFIDKNDYDKAIEYCLQQIENIPTASDAYKLITKIYYTKRDLSTAMHYSNLLMELFPEDIEGYSFTLEFLFMDYKNKEAIELADKIKIKFPKETLGYLYHGYILFEEGKYDEAIEIANKCPNPDDSRIKSLLLMIQGKSVVTFTDPSFEAAFRKYLYRETDDILFEDAYNIQGIEISGGDNPTIVFDGTPCSLDSALESLEDIRYFEYLYSLEIRRQDNSVDFSPLSSLTNLYYLSLVSTGVTDISFVENLPFLVYLSITDGKLENITEIEKLTNLETLDLQHNKIKNLPKFDKMEKLISVYLNNNLLSDISNLSKATTLKSLYLSDNIKISDISSLRTLTNLSSLSLGGCSVTDYSPVEHVENLIID